MGQQRGTKRQQATIKLFADTGQASIDLTTYCITTRYQNNQNLISLLHTALQSRLQHYALP